MTGVEEKRERKGHNSEATEKVSLGKSRKDKTERRHSKDRSKSSNSHSKSRREGGSHSQQEKRSCTEAQPKEKPPTIGDVADGKGGRAKEEKAVSAEKSSRSRKERGEDRGESSHRAKREEVEASKDKDKVKKSEGRGGEKKLREKDSSVDRRRKRDSRHSSHRSKDSARDHKHKREDRSSVRHKSDRHRRHRAESSSKSESRHTHTSSKRKRSSADTGDADEEKRENKRCVTAAVEAVPAAAPATAVAAAGATPAAPAAAAAAIGGAGPAVGVPGVPRECGKKAIPEMNRALPASRQQTSSPPPPPPAPCTAQLSAVKDVKKPQAMQQRGRAAAMTARGSPSPPRGGMRYKGGDEEVRLELRCFGGVLRTQSRSNSRGRERRSPSYGAYRGRDISEERQQPRAAPEEEAEAEGEDEDELFDLSLTGGRFGELLDQEVTCSVVGGDATPPEPADTLDGCKEGSPPLLDPLVVENLKKLKCRWLLPIQRYAIPIVAKGHDLLGCAATGCGKTLAFLAPLVSRVIGCGGLFRPHFPGSHAQASPLSVVLCPTRELAIQIDEQLDRLMAGSNLSHSLWIGGVSATEQVHEINQRQIDVAICTPGRVDELCLRGKVTLEFVQLLVLDEADAMLDLGFQKVMTELATSRDMPENRQTLLFSATFPPNLLSMLPSILRTPYFRVDVGKSSARLRDETAIIQVVKWIDGWNEKLAELVKDIQAFMESLPDGGNSGQPGEGGQVIVFVSGKRTVKSVSDHLKAANIGTETLFGTMQQEQRKQVYLTFRSRKVRALVATSIAARGLDFPDVGLVINFEMPPTIEPYVHRIGRTGRAGRSGKAISYFSQKDAHLANPLINHLTKCKAPIPPWLGRLAK